MNNKLSLLLVTLLAAGTLSGCSNAKEQLGLSRSAPDEFAVVKRAPLEMPPDYSLRPPRPGVARPQEQAVTDQAREVVFGADTSDRQAAPANGEAALLQQAGADQANPDIRGVIDRESVVIAPEKQPVVKRLFGINVGGTEEDTGVLDAEKEADRLKAQHSAQQAADSAAEQTAPVSRKK